MEQYHRKPLQQRGSDITLAFCVVRDCLKTHLRRRMEASRAYETRQRDTIFASWINNFYGRDRTPATSQTVFRGHPSPRIFMRPIGPETTARRRGAHRGAGTWPGGAPASPVAYEPLCAVVTRVG